MLTPLTPKLAAKSFSIRATLGDAAATAAAFAVLLVRLS
jgi:hypothetical protein